MIIGSNLYHFDELTSTSSHAQTMLKAGAVKEGSVIYTDYQVSGRGRGSNKWESEKGKNLLFSIILYPHSVLPGDQFMISMAISLAICDFCDTICLGSKIKWPNDIYFKDDKIAGILIENSILGNRIENTIAGIGININQESFPSFLKNAGSLRMLTENSFDLEKCLKDILQALDKRYSELLSGNIKLIRDEYLSRLYRLNEWHHFFSGNRLFKGMITGVSGSGLLQIREENGISMDYGYKEVEFIHSLTTH